MASNLTLKVTADDRWLAGEGDRGGIVPLSYSSARGADAATRRRIAKSRALLEAGRVDDARLLARAAMTIDDYRVSEWGINERVAGAIAELNTDIARAGRAESVESIQVESCPTDTVPSSDMCPVCVSVDGDCLCAPVETVEPCPCGGSYVDGVCWSCDSCSGCAECAPSHSYAGSVSHEVLSVDVQRHAAYLDAPASVVARVTVRYSFPDAPDRVHGFLFSSSEDEPWSVRMTSTSPRGTGLVTVFNPARFGSFSDDPVSWVHAFYA